MVKAYVYKGGFSLVKKSGIGSAVAHQEEMLKRAGIPMAKTWKEASVIHINTIFPDSLAAACLAGKQGKFVIYYGHSTMEDFKNSFIGSNQMASFFKKWICFCYGKGDIILTPTRYSGKLLKSYGIKKKDLSADQRGRLQLFQERSGYRSEIPVEISYSEKKESRDFCRPLD